MKKVPWLRTLWECKLLYKKSSTFFLLLTPIYFRMVLDCCLFYFKYYKHGDINIILPK